MSGNQIGKKIWILGGIVTILAVALFFGVLQPRHILYIKDLDNGRTVLETRVKPGDNIWIIFINSVENLPVADHFAVDRSYKLMFTETIYRAPYAGYDDSEKARAIAPATVRIPGFDRPMQDITFYAGYTSRHMLFLNGNWVPLYDVAQGGDLIQITVKSGSVLSALTGKASAP